MSFFFPDGDEPAPEELDRMNVAQHAPVWNGGGLGVWFGTPTTILASIEEVEGAGSVRVRIEDPWPSFDYDRVTVVETEEEAMRLVNEWWVFCLEHLLQEALSKHEAA